MSTVDIIAIITPKEGKIDRVSSSHSILSGVETELEATRKIRFFICACHTIVLVKSTRAVASTAYHDSVPVKVSVAVPGTCPWLLYKQQELGYEVYFS